MNKNLFVILFVSLFTLHLNGQQQRNTQNIRKPYKICFNNNTSKTVYVAIRYKTVSGSWKTSYWFKYRPYEKDENKNKFVVKTYNRYFYYYAKTKPDYNGKYRVWKGSIYKNVDGKRVGMKEVYLSKSMFKNPRGQNFYMNLKY